VHLDNSTVEGLYKKHAPLALMFYRSQRAIAISIRRAYSWIISVYGLPDVREVD
jgi:hypothetical protein